MREFLCDFMKWHKCKKTGSDGISDEGYCIHCGRECLKDSQGNWFEKLNRKRYFKK